MSSANRRPYLTSNVLDQQFLNACHDNLENKLELVVDIETPTGFIRASDRPKYVGDVFYDNRLKFPIISRTVGEWLQTEIELSVLKLSLNNSDGKYNEFLPGGGNYDGFIGRTVHVRLGLRDVESTYTTIFRGTISDVGGFARNQTSIVITARDDYEKLSVMFPKGTLTQASFPNINDDVAGSIAPVIYGDWTGFGNNQADNSSVPAFVVNGQAAKFSPLNPVELYISETDLTYFDTDSVWLKRGEKYFHITSTDVFDVSVGNRQFKITQDSGATLVESGANYIYEDGDIFFCKVKGKDLGAYDDNIVSICRDILISQAGVLVGEFDSSWDYFRDKASPSESAIAAIKCRVWIQEPKSVLEFVLSLLEQVRLEMFINRDLKLQLNSLHLDDYEAVPAYKISNFDLVEGSLSPSLDVRNNFNRIQGIFNFQPDINDNAYKTAIWENFDAVLQMKRAISKQITFPNLYIRNDVINQIKEILRLSSAGYEHISLEITWRGLLLDIGDFVFLDVKIGSTIYEEIPCMIRNIGYDPEGIKLPMKLWSFQLVPFPGFSGAPGSVGGNTASITEVFEGI